MDRPYSGRIRCKTAEWMIGYQKCSPNTQRPSWLKSKLGRGRETAAATWTQAKKFIRRTIITTICTFEAYFVKAERMIQVWRRMRGILWTMEASPKAGERPWSCSYCTQDKENGFSQWCMKNPLGCCLGDVARILKEASDLFVRLLPLPFAAPLHAFRYYG